MASDARNLTIPRQLWGYGDGQGKTCRKPGKVPQPTQAVTLPAGARPG